MSSNPLESDHGMKDAPDQRSIPRELERLGKHIDAQAEYIDRLISQLKPVMRSDDKPDENDNSIEAVNPTELGQQINRYSAGITRNTDRIMLVLGLLEL